MTTTTIPSVARDSLAGRNRPRVGPPFRGTTTLGAERGCGSPKETVVALLDERPDVIAMLTDGTSLAAAPPRYRP